MHFSQIDIAWSLILAVGIGLYTMTQGGGWDEFLDNGGRFTSWRANYSLHLFLILLCSGIILACVWLYFH